MTAARRSTGTAGVTIMTGQNDAVHQTSVQTQEEPKTFFVREYKPVSGVPQTQDEKDNLIAEYLHMITTEIQVHHPEHFLGLVGHRYRPHDTYSVDFFWKTYVTVLPQARQSSTLQKTLENQRNEQEIATNRIWNHLNQSRQSLRAIGTVAPAIPLKLLSREDYDSHFNSPYQDDLRRLYLIDYQYQELTRQLALALTERSVFDHEQIAPENFFFYKGLSTEMSEQHFFQHRWESFYVEKAFKQADEWAKILSKSSDITTKVLAFNNIKTDLSKKLFITDEFKSIALVDLFSGDKKQLQEGATARKESFIFT